MKKVTKSRLIALSGSKIMVLKKIGESRRYTFGGIKKNKESELESLIRETAEEINLELSAEQVLFFLFHINNNHEKVVHRHYFLVELTPIKYKVREKHKFQKVQWLEWKKAIKYMDRSDRWAIQAHFKNKSTNKRNLRNDGRKISPRIAV